MKVGCRGGGVSAMFISQCLSSRPTWRVKRGSAHAAVGCHGGEMVYPKWDQATALCASQVKRGAALDLTARACTVDCTTAGAVGRGHYTWTHVRRRLARSSTMQELQGGNPPILVF